MNTTYKSHGNQQRSLRQNLRNVQRLSRKGVEPSGSKREETLKGVYEIVCSAYERCRRSEVANPVATQGIQRDVYGHTAPRSRPKSKDDRRGVSHHLISWRTVHGSRGRALPPVPLHQTSLQLVRRFPRQLNCVTESAPSMNKNQREEGCFSSRCTHRNMAQDCRGCIPLLNRRDPDQTSEPPLTDQHRVDMYRQPYISSDRRSTALYHNRRNSDDRCI